MKFDALKQYAKLKQQLTEEKSELETRLNEINQVLGSESTTTRAAQSSSAPQAPVRTGARRGRKPRGDNSMSLKDAVLKALSNGPLARKELVPAIEKVGYVFTTKNPLNSIGAILYAKKGPVKSQGGKYFVDGGAVPVSSGNGNHESAPAPAKKKKRKLSPEGRAAIQAAAKARWAKKRAGK